MQPASGFIQLAAAGRIGATKYMFTVFFKGKCSKCIRMGITIFKISFGEVYPDLRSEITFYGSAYASP